MNKLNHLAIIMDGNRRWAKKRNLPSLEGHRNGYNTLKKTGEWCQEKGIGILTIYAFSVENWNRKEEEVSYLNKLIIEVFKKDLNWIYKNGWKLKISGDLSRYSKEIQKVILEAEEKTKNNKDFTLVVCLNYGGRNEIVNAVRKIVKSGIEEKEINEEIIKNNLYVSDIPDPDLIVRTGGELRLSNFLMWQSAYSELYFSKTLWPDFSKEEFEEILEEYENRQRRFGK